MERWKRPHYRGGDCVTAASLAVNGCHPSFSSSLLDAIDRSIDKVGVGGGRRERRAAGADMKEHDQRENYSHHAAAYRRVTDDRYSTAAALKQSATVSEKVSLRRRGSADYDPPQQQYRRTQPLQRRERFFGNSTSSSSESSYGGFSSSEAESVVLSARPLPRPVRTTGPPERKSERLPTEENNQQKAKGSIRSRFRASKLYSELKKGRTTPVSPGARLANFLNTLFSTAGNPKKPKICTAVNSAAGGRGGEESACSSASSYSRSCLSKTPSSRGKTTTVSSGGGSKRSVRFYPVSVIVDEDCRPCGQKSIYEDAKPDYFLSEPLLTAVRVRDDPPPGYCPAAAGEEERKRAMEAARGLVSAYKEKKRGLEGFVLDEEDEEQEEDDDDEDDDAASYSSSDLFELKNLAAVGGGGGEVRFRDELPVYGTTHLDTNRAIAQRLTV